jgi:alkaline phosphatase D
MAIKRRELLEKMGLTGVALAVGCGDDDGSDLDGGLDAQVPEIDGGQDMGPIDMGPPEPTGPFRHGIASGDPLSDAVILWTHLTTDETMAEVGWAIATDPAMSDVVGSGTVMTDASRDFTVKVDVTGLSPATTYYYQFTGAGTTSRVGRTRTAPTGGVDRLRFAVMSCSSFNHGYFHAYRHVSERADIDAVLHLGDYIYEYAPGDYGSVRAADPPNEIVTLEDYRRRYAQYRRDGDLQAAHQQHPFIVVWDDHETANNSYEDGAQNHDPATEGDWEERKANAFQAYLEWMPIRETEMPLQIWRSLRYGDLLELLMLDTRIWGRDEEATQETRTDPEREILGADQEAWLIDRLENSTAQWKVLGQQVMFGHFENESDDGTFRPINLDQWDGYAAARMRLLDVFADVDDVLVLTGDIHSSWVMDLTPVPHTDGYDPATGEGAVAVEFVTSAVSSPGIVGLLGDTLAEIALEQNSHIHYVNLGQRGYYVLELTAERAQADYFLLDGVAVEEGAQEFTIAFEVPAGVPHASEASGPLAMPSDAPELAPDPPPRPL